MLPVPGKDRYAKPGWFFWRPSHHRVIAAAFNFNFFYVLSSGHDGPCTVASRFFKP